MATTTKMDNDDAGVGVDETKYRGMIGCSLLYLTVNKLDILFCIGICGQFQSKPKESHIKVVK